MRELGDEDTLPFPTAEKRHVCAQWSLSSKTSQRFGSGRRTGADSM